MSTVLLTGIAGFIGSWTAEALLKKGHKVIGVDNFNDYYDPALKRARVKKFSNKATVHKADVSDAKAMEKLFKKHKFDQVCHLAAQAGVGYSLKKPMAYEISNNMGTLTLLELCKRYGVKSFIYASSSSVYGGNKKVPFSVKDPVEKPISIYAATKRYNELLAHTYHHLYGIHCTGLRFFTVYGPWGRPDMALFKFTKAIQAGKPIDVYNNGRMKRDFTYITDIVSGIIASLERNYPYEIFNLGNSKTVELTHFIDTIEKSLGQKAVRNSLPMQAGDVPETCADIDYSREKLGFNPTVNIEEGVQNFMVWYKDYYRR